MNTMWAPAPFRIAFDNARDPYTARNALGISPGGGGNVSNSGTPTLGQYAKWVTATTIQGVSAATVLGDIGAQPLDADLTALAALTGTNTIYYRSAANTWTPVVVSTGLAFSGGNLTATGSGGNVSNSGTPAANDVAQWVTSTTIKGVPLTTWRTTATFYGTTSFRSTVALPANGFDIVPAVTGDVPEIDAVGIDTDISLAIKGKGTGVIDFYGQGVRQAQIGNVAGASTYVRLRGAVGQGIIDAVGGGKVNIIDANLSGAPIAVTAAAGDNSTAVATTAWMQGAFPTGAWTAWTPTVTSGTGTITSSTVNIARYTKAGKAVTAYFDVSITNAGTGGSFLNLTVPVAVSASGGGMGVVREVTVTGSMGVAIVNPSATQIAIVVYNGGTFVTAGYRIVGSVTYESA